MLCHPDLGGVLFLGHRPRSLKVETHYSWEGGVAGEFHIPGKPDLFESRKGLKGLPSCSPLHALSDETGLVDPAV